jgi:hypothetical protein
MWKTSANEGMERKLFVLLAIEGWKFWRKMGTPKKM